MRGHHRHHPHGGNGRYQPRAQAPPQPQAGPINHNVFFQNPNFLQPLQNSSNFIPNGGGGGFQSMNNHHSQTLNPMFGFQNFQNFTSGVSPNFPNVPIQSPNLPTQQYSGFLPQHGYVNNNHNNHGQCSSQGNPTEVMERINRAVAEAHRNMVAARENVSTFKVSQSVLSMLQVDSWNTLGVQIQEVPALREMMALEGKIYAFIHCFVGVRKITSLYDLQVAVCKEEDVEHFEDLELGPLLQHPLVLHYFQLNTSVTEVFKITTEEIILFLGDFINAHGRMGIKTDDFLNFLAEKKTFGDKEKLGVRITSLRLHVRFIHNVKRQEDGPLKNFLRGSKPKTDRFSSRKQQLDKRFSAISQRVESFSSVHPNFRGKHTRFNSSSSDDDNSDDATYEDSENVSDDSNLKPPSKNISGSDHVSSCPYPSAVEEMVRLGLKGEISDHSSPASGTSRRAESLRRIKKKRKREHVGSPISTSYKLLKKENNKQDVKDVSRLSDTDILLSDETIRTFISTWKDACKELKLAEVLRRMVLFYKPVDYSVPDQEEEETSLMLSSFPFVGLLNVAVESIKQGMWDTIYDSFQTFSEHKSHNSTSEYVIIDVESSAKHGPVSANCETRDTNTEEIIKRVSTYFGNDNEIQNAKISKGKNTSLLRKLCNCQIWLADQLRVKEFKSLGYGDFFTFLEKHMSLLPTELQNFLAGEVSEKFPLEVCMLEHMLIVLISQASSSLWENELVTKEMISGLLTRQFPSLSFRTKENGTVETLMDVLKSFKNDVVSKSVIFSRTLLRSDDPLAHEGNFILEPSAARTENGLGGGFFKYVTTKEAVEVLLRAPFLSDLNLWSHWDIAFAPSLGPLVGWLLNEVNTKELLCLVTKDGKVIRIDHSATVDSFLEAALQGSAHSTAVKLVSLITLSGGEKHVSLSLLKCHARRAFEVIVNDLEKNEGSDSRNSFLQQKPLSGQMTIDEYSTKVLSSKLQNNIMKMNKVVPAACRFVLDCLGHLPSEFHSFVADVLLSGLRHVVKDAPSAILLECEKPDHRVMLHQVGLLLGIVEWVNDYNAFSSGASSFKETRPEFSTLSQEEKKLCTTAHTDKKAVDSNTICERSVEYRDVCGMTSGVEVSGDGIGRGCIQKICGIDEDIDPSFVIESIRRDEFGLDSDLSDADSSMLKKQHARLGRALHCLSQELYSQDSHFLLELVQNADDNIYPENVDPTLTFILQKSGVIILNNERGFAAENIRALCDVGRSTKKGSGGYIGQKGIGFKSVFRVSDAPEIHSNGFHVKFDISEGQIGFVLPTVVPPANIDLFARELSGHASQLNKEQWNTCIVLPFKSRISEGITMDNIEAMFSDLHPSLLLFLHRLQCIVFQNFLDNSIVVMKKEIVGDGIVKVSCGEEKMTWFVASKKLRADRIRRDVQTTEISIAFTLQESDNGTYNPHLSQQPVFAFLPLRTYGLKFILQGDFVLPSSREEVDGDSPWNQWLLSEFPELFVTAVKLFCNHPCFKNNPGKAVGAYMSFVPLVGEVHGFFSCLPRIIISKMRQSNCLLLEGDDKKWVPPCKVLRGWNGRVRALLPDGLLHEHLGLGFMDKDILLTDSLSRALGIEDYGAKVLVQMLSALSHPRNALKSMGLGWLSSWLNELYTLTFHSSGQTSSHLGVEFDLLGNLRKIPFIPLSDGTYSSLDEGTIWLHADVHGFDGRHRLEEFPKLYAKLRTVNSLLFSSSTVNASFPDVALVSNITSMLSIIGVQQLSAHEIVKVHILPAMHDKTIENLDKSLMIDYLCFIMIHLQSGCPDCSIDREQITSDLRNKAFILTNYGFKRLNEIPIHCGKFFGNRVDVKKLISDIDMKWHEVDIAYLKHPASESHACGLKKWREFFLEIGVTDFVEVLQIEKSIDEMSCTTSNDSKDRSLISTGSMAKDWISRELVHLLSQLSLKGKRDSCKYVLETLDMLWDECFSDKTTLYCKSLSGDSLSFRSSFITNICDIQWVASSIDDKLHCPTDLFFDCEEVRLILGTAAPYVVPKVRSEKLLNDIGFKTKVTLDDILEILEVWKSSATTFKASIAQMTRMYKFIWNEMTNSKQKIAGKFHSAQFIFVPYESGTWHEDVVPGLFLSHGQVCWHDSTGSVDEMKVVNSQCGSVTPPLCIKTLSNVYPGLHDFFVNECRVFETPSFHGYLQILLQLSRDALPSCASGAVFRVFLKWADELKSEQCSEDFLHLKECLKKLEFTVLPTEHDKWVSLHHSFGLVCWSDDKKLKSRFKHMNNIEFLNFGKVSDEELEKLQSKLSILMRTLEIPALTEVVTREAIYEGLADSSSKMLMLNWALPYAQRYIYSLHREKYFELKQSGYDNINHLQFLVVEKLYYRNVIERCGATSKKQNECNSLLQGNILYTTLESDSHSLFLELSRLFFDGTPDLHLANFLHMITTMVGSGSNQEQIEPFILNSQNVQKIPDEESVWSLSSVLSSSTGHNATNVMNEKDTPNPKMKQLTNGNWPAVDLRTAPGFAFARANGFITQPSSGSETGNAQPHAAVPINIDANLLTSDYPTMFLTGSNLPETTNQIGYPCAQNDASVNVAMDPTDGNLVSVGNEFCSSEFRWRDQLSTGTPNPLQAHRTGRQGEEVAYKYLTSQYPNSVVKWVNEFNETGLPYDITIGDDEDDKQYIEVKATVSARKDWFHISAREWQFAAEKGESFIIAHVLLGSFETRLTMHTNPVKRCQEGKLRLLIMMPSQQKEISIVHNE